MKYAHLFFYFFFAFGAAGPSTLWKNLRFVWEALPLDTNHTHVNVSWVWQIGVAVIAIMYFYSNSPLKDLLRRLELLLFYRCH